MRLRIPTNRLKIILILLLVLVGIGTFVYNQYLINNLLQQERTAVELWAKAIEYAGRPLHKDTRQDLEQLAGELEQLGGLPNGVQNSWVRVIQQAESELANVSLDLASELIVQNRFRIPSVVVDEQGNIKFTRNIDEEKLTDQRIQELKRANPPIEIEVGGVESSQTQYVYYGESFTVRLLRYFPYVQIGLLALLLGIGYTTYSSIRRAEQSSLWVGMAKEAAHQLGTPISSMYGWIELFKERNQDDESSLKIANELENDVKRLQNVAERFNKIGSEAELKPRRIAPILHQVIDYMERRLPQLGNNVKVHREINDNVKVNVNVELFQWAVENLVKNAMDAIKSAEGNPYVSVKTRHSNGDLYIEVEDSGKGIEKKYHKEIFKPGYSTKKRGWGLGLSLTKRIIEEYHNGKIYVSESTPGKGTTIRIEMKQTNKVKGEG